MKTLYKILNTINSKYVFGFIQNQKSNLNSQKGELHSEKNSLLDHMYSAENDNLFI